jgi:hypothetical protein
MAKPKLALKPGSQQRRPGRIFFAGPTPRCATSAEYQSWRQMALVAHPSIELGFCEDCSPEYQREMKLQERCENPAVRFDGGHARIKC